MPIWDQTRLKAAIAGGEIGAISLDTSTFDAAECNLRWRVFESLVQFKGTGIRYLLTDVVVGEVRAHICKRAEDAATSLKAAAREFDQAWGVSEAVAKAASTMAANPDPSVAAQAEIDRYLAASSASILGCAGLVDLNSVLDSYFAPKPPFEARSEKKNEFPDAFALHALEAWARARSKYVVAVSTDSGWKKYAAESEWVVWFEKLRPLLGHFNEEATFVAKRAIALLNEGSAQALSEAIEGEIQRFVDDMYPDIKASSGFWLDTDYEGATLVGRSEIDINTVNAVASSQQSIVMSFDVDFTIEAAANFIFKVKDDREYIPIAGAAASRTIDLTLPFTIEIGPNVDALEIYGIDAAGDPSVSLDFGDIEPDWDGDEDYEE